MKIRVLDLCLVIYTKCQLFLRKPIYELRPKLVFVDLCIKRLWLVITIEVFGTASRETRSIEHRQLVFLLPFASV